MHGLALDGDIQKSKKFDRSPRHSHQQCSAEGGPYVLTMWPLQAVCITASDWDHKVHSEVVRAVLAEFAREH